ncbi:MAG: CpsB/CapC family capsule biosynthesis tyrosine phosphatase [Gemmatimonadaceae bacterium]|jgi:tyrosine-protein phosphatase YwqE
MTAGPGTDFHSHLIPGVDDGAADLAASRAAVAAMARDGVATAITTPHFDGSLTLTPSMAEQRLAQLDAGFAALTSDAEVTACGIQLMRGVELMLDVPDPDVSDPRLRLNGGRFVLVEYPGLQLPLSHADYAVRALRDKGWQPVLAHPERYRNVDDALEQLLPLRFAGAYFQVNAGSLVGYHGDGPRRRAAALLARGWVEYGSSDYHGRGAPAVAAARAALAASGAAEQAELLFCENPARLVRDESPRTVDPTGQETRKPHPWWVRLFSRR